MVEKAFGILIIMSWFRVLLGTMEQRARVVRDIVFTSVVLLNMLRTHQGGANRAPTPANDVVALQNEEMVYVPNGNYRNPLRETTIQQELLKDYFNQVGRRTGSEMFQPTTLGEEADIYHSFSGLLSVVFRTTH